MRGVGCAVVVFAVGCSSLNPDFDDDGATSGSGGSSGAVATTGPTGAATTGTGDGVDASGDGATTEGPIGDVEFTDDAFEGEFGAGVLVELAWSDALGLAASSVDGRLDSRVFGVGDDVEWTSITWVPAAPYGRPLPDGGASESAYESGNADMSDLVLLMHLDDIERDEVGAYVLDTSGVGTNAYVREGAMDLTGGVFGRALHDMPAEGTPYLSASAANLVPGTSDFTWSTWVRTDSCGTGATFVSVDDPINLAGTTSIWFECVAGSGCGNAVGVVAAAARFGGSGPVACSTTRIDDGQWHHLAMRKEGHPTATLTVFVDGQAESAASEPLAGALVDSNTLAFSLMGQADPAYPAEGDLDELAMWHRALSDTEIADLYLRGARQLRFRVRGCADALCDDGSFVGPDGNADSAFIDRAPVPGDPQPLAPLIAPALQYEASFSRDLDSIGSPKLRSITIRGQRL